MELFDKSKFRDKAELFAHLIENKSQLMARRKSVVKHADSIPFMQVMGGGHVANKAVVTTSDTLNANLVINTTKLLDSHLDVHIDKLWDRTLNANGYFDLNQEHKQGFKDIISDGQDIKAYTKIFSWKELGFSYEGDTQALMYEATIKQTRNPYMFDQYNKGYVRNHSVEMYYVKQLLAINDPQYKEEYANYEKYFPMISNKEDEVEGYFFPVLEAKHTGGAAVKKGSNFATPVESIKNEPPQGTQNIDPSKDTLTKEDIVNAFKKISNE